MIYYPLLERGVDPGIIRLVKALLITDTFRASTMGSRGKISGSISKNNSRDGWRMSEGYDGKDGYLCF
jgi:hypothetical protein